jgi:hypothetical protein
LAGAGTELGKNNHKYSGHLVLLQYQKQKTHDQMREFS